MNAVYSTLIQELHQFAKKNQLDRAVLELSGDLNSAVALCVAVRAFGPKNVTALVLPEMGVTPPLEIDHARVLAEHFGCVSHYQPINNFLVDYHFVPWEKTPASHELLKGRIRASLLRQYADSANALYMGTASKSDLLLGLGTLDGDAAGDIHVLGDLYKTDVWELARWIGLPDELLQKDDLDEILRELIDGTDPDTLIQKGMDALLVHKTVRLVEANEKKLGLVNVISIGQIPKAIQAAQAAEASSLS